MCACVCACVCVQHIKFIKQKHIIKLNKETKLLAKIAKIKTFSLYPTHIVTKDIQG